MTDLPSLDYVKPRSLAQVLAALEGPGAAVYAGGTDLLVALQQRSPTTAWIRSLVDIKGLAEARGIGVRDGVVRIGALVTAHELAASRVVCRHVPVLAEAARATSAPLLRMRGTIGGNLVTPHSAGDVATALLASDARVEVATRRGGRRHLTLRALARLSRPPLILAVYLSAAPGAYERVAHRHRFARAIAAVAVVHRGAAYGVAVGGVAARPVGARLGRRALEDAAPLDELLQAAIPALRSLDATRRRLVASLVRRAAERTA